MTEHCLSRSGARVGVVGDTLDIGLRLDDLKLSWSESPDSSVKFSLPGDIGTAAGLLLLRLLLGGEQDGLFPLSALPARHWYPSDRTSQ